MRRYIYLIVLLLVGCEPAPQTPALTAPDVAGLPDVAVSQLNKAYRDATEAPGDAAKAGHYAMVLQAYTQDDAAERAYAHARTLAPKRFRWVYLHAYLLESLGKADAAADAYAQALAIDPRHQLAQIRLGRLEFDRGNLDRAREMFEAALERQTYRTAAQLGLAQTLSASGDTDKAHEIYTFVLERTPRQAQAHFGLAQIERARGDSDAAAEHLRQFEQYKDVVPRLIDPLLSSVGLLNQSDRPEMQRARQALARGDLAGGIRHLENAVERNPANIGARVSLIGLYAANNDFSRVEQLHAEALTLEPNNVKLHFNYGFALQRQGRQADALVSFDRALALAPEDADSLAYRAVSLLETGDRAAAYGGFEKALAANPRQREANARYGLMLTQDGEPERAIAYLEKATQRDDPFSLDYLPVLAEALQAVDRAGAANAALERALKLARRFGDERAGEIAEALSD